MISTKPYQGIPNNIKNASYVFCDLAHYSEFVRTHELKAVMQYLKEYYDWIIPLAKEFHGRTVDILGDGMGSLFWGEDHAHHAFHFGLTILKELPTHHFPFSLKIGMSAGQVSDTLRMDKDMIIFTLVGQGVIEACRSENLSHKVHQNFLLTAHLYNLLSTSDRSLVKSIGPYLLKGMSEKTTIYTLKKSVVSALVPHNPV